jgi:hypothetical protein
VLPLVGAALTVSSASNADREGGAEPGLEVWASYFRETIVWGYADKHSVRPGEHFSIMLSTSPRNPTARGQVEFFRVEPLTVADGQRLVWRSPTVDVTTQSVLRTASAIGVCWPPTMPEIDTTTWPPGYYSADFVHDSGARDLQIAQIAVTNPTPSGEVLLKLCTNTYQAYNSWGGHSLYPTEDDRRGAIVSFDRPCGPAFFEYDVYLARWLETVSREKGFAVDYVTNFDVHRDPTILDGYKLVATGGHDEYWSKEEFDAFEKRIFVRGKNVIFFGANTAYFQIRYADINRPPGDSDWGRQLICHKSLDDPIARRKGTTEPELLLTARFRDGQRRPEIMLTGVAYQDWFPSEGPAVPYHVANVDLPYFEGTGYRVGDVAADVVGYEWDNRDPAQDNRRLWDRNKSRNALLPADRLHVVFMGTAEGEKTKRGLAEAVYFESEAGAKVFSSGAIRWAWGLGKPGFERQPFKKFNENLVLGFLRS